MNKVQNLEPYYRLIEDAARSMLEERQKFERTTGVKMPEQEFACQCVRLGILLFSGITGSLPQNGKPN